MHFSDEAAANLEQTVFDIVSTVLKAGFASTENKAKFQDYGGVPITRNPDAGHQWFVKDKRPFIFFQLDGDEQHGWQKVVDDVKREGARHELTITLEAICPKATAEAERPLKDALRRILEGSYFALRSAGLEGSTVRVMKPEEAPDRRNPHALTATVYTL